MPSMIGPSISLKIPDQIHPRNTPEGSQQDGLTVERDRSLEPRRPSEGICISVMRRTIV